MNKKNLMMDESRTRELFDILDTIYQNMEQINVKIQNFTGNSSLNDCSDDCDQQDLSEDLTVLEATFPLQINHLATIKLKNPLAVNSHNLIAHFSSTVKIWSQTGKLRKLSDSDINTILKFTRELRTELRLVRAAKEQENIDVTLESNVDSVGTGQVAKVAEGYIKAKGRALEMARRTELLSKVIIEALEDMASLDIGIDDYKRAMDYLIRSSQHLSKLRVAWGDIRKCFILNFLFSFSPGRQFLI